MVSFLLTYLEHFSFFFRQREKETTHKGKKYDYHVMRTEAEVSCVTAFQIFSIILCCFIKFRAIKEQ